MMNTRNLFAELVEGFDALSNARAGKQTLRTHEVEINPVPEVTAAELGRAKPNAQAALLIRMVEKFPDTVERLAAV